MQAPVNCELEFIEGYDYSMDWWHGYVIHSDWVNIIDADICQMPL